MKLMNFYAFQVAFHAVSSEYRIFHFQNTSMWGLFKQRTIKIGVVWLYRLTRQNIRYTQHFKTPHLQVWGLFEPCKIELNIFFWLYFVVSLIWANVYLYLCMFYINNKACLYFWQMLHRSTTLITNGRRKQRQAKWRTKPHWAGGCAGGTRTRGEAAAGTCLGVLQRGGNIWPCRASSEQDEGEELWAGADAIWGIQDA